MTPDASERVRIRDATRQQDLESIADLAQRVWRAHYPGIISQAQIDYMLARAYSVEALQRQARSGHIFQLLLAGERPIAYASFSPSSEDQVEAQIHTFYVLGGEQGRGRGRMLMEHIVGRLRTLGMRSVILTVNRHNIAAINFYFRMGFTIRSVVDTDIGDGFLMNDFVMVRALPA